MNTPELTSKNILITGAGGRIGSAVARQALSAGATVVLADISPTSLQNVLSELSSFNQSHIHTCIADITTLEGIDSLLSSTSSLVGAIDGAVHCAYPRSAGWGTRFEDMQPEHLFADLNMQLGGAILFSQRIIHFFQSQGHGNLIHLSSIQGIHAPKFEHYAGTSMSSPIEYAAIKSGIISIVRWLAKYCSNQNIRINCVSPGGIIDCQPSIFVNRYRESCSNIGMLSADQVAGAIIFLLADSSEAINGQNIVVDDGWSL